MATYPRAGASEAPAQPDFPELENRVLAYWNSHGTFRKSIENREGAGEFVFYDGPPFANGLPHYGHLLTGYVKDIVPRYKTMRGEKVDRRFGWDTHGLPAEVEAERLLGISGKADILKMGIETFNEACRDSVLRYTREWQEYVTRQARWVDFDNDYKTLDLPYMESVMWAFKALHDKGLVYQGFKVLPYCWRCETPLSNHELRMDDDVYADRTDPSVTVRFKLETGEWILAWTTTPWTLPSNLAVAVGPGHQLRHRGDRGRRAVHPGRGAAARLREGACAGRASSTRSEARNCSAAATSRCSTTSPTPRRSAPATRGGSSPPTR